MITIFVVVPAEYFITKKRVWINNPHSFLYLSYCPMYGKCITSAHKFNDSTLWYQYNFPKLLVATVLLKPYKQIGNLLKTPTKRLQKEYNRIIHDEKIMYEMVTSDW